MPIWLSFGRYMVIGAVTAAMALPAGCNRESEPVKPKPRPVPGFQPPTTGAVQSGDEGGAGGFVHPPIGGESAEDPMLPPGHPPLEPKTSTQPALELTFTPPPEWETQPARMMTHAVYRVPKVENDTEDADLAISTLSARVPLAMNVDRWCSQFELDKGQTCAEAAQQEKLEGTVYPTTIVQISGGYRGMSMGGAPASSKPGYRMLAAEIVAPDKLWYVKLVGPEQTVEHWSAAFTQFVREVK